MLFFRGEPIRCFCKFQFFSKVFGDEHLFLCEPVVQKPCHLPFEGRPVDPGYECGM